MKINHQNFIRIKETIHSFFLKFNNKNFYFIYIFILFFILFSIIYFFTSNTASVDDPYFHIKYAYLLRTNHLLYLIDFPWVQFTGIDKFIDSTFIFHLLLIPFTFGNLIYSIKVLGILLSSIFFLLIYLILKKKKNRYPFFWTILLLGIAPSYFIFRGLLVRPEMLSIFLLFVFIFLTFQKKNWPYFLLGAIYILSHSSYYLLLGMAFFYVLFLYIHQKKINYRIFLFTLFGIIVGFILIPNMELSNFYRYFTSPFFIIQKEDLTVSIRELNPLRYGIFEYINSNGVIFISLFVFAIIFRIYLFLNKAGEIFIKNKAKFPLIDTLFIISILLFVISLQGIRFIQYFVPFAFLFFVFMLDIALKELHFNSVLIKKSFQAFIIIFILILIFNNFTIILGIINEGYPPQLLEASSGWLKENTKRGEVVFLRNWSSFPLAFFYNHHNYYTMGFDYRATYNYNQKLFWLWQNIFEDGNPCDQSPDKCVKSQHQFVSERARKMAEAIKNDFRSKYILVAPVVPQDHISNYFLENLEQEKYFKKVFQDEKFPVSIYQIN